MLKYSNSKQCLLIAETWQGNNRSMVVIRFGGI